MQAIIFDFDGIIIDTETPCYQSWEEIYREYGLELPMDLWLSFLGGSGESDYDPIEHIESLVDGHLDREVIRKKEAERERELLSRQPLMPGVLAYLETAGTLGLKLGVASSSSARWVKGHLEERGLLHYFDAITTADDVERTKPDPAVYLLALERLGVDAGQALVFEDSLNGVRAAQRAGIFTVAIPNEISAQTPLEDHADMMMASFEDMPLERLLAIVSGN
jgi:HAD superfamily hydrolase (TIGR01509 family)